MSTKSTPQIKREALRRLQKKWQADIARITAKQAKTNLSKLNPYFVELINKK